MSLDRNNLRSWQIAAIERAATGSLLIAAAPGAGKAITKLTAIADGLAAGRFRRVLLVAPRIVIDTVLISEAAKWKHTAHLTFSTAHAYTGDARQAAIFNTGANIITMTPDLLPSLLTSIVERNKLPFDAIFIDESQAFKNPTSVRSKALLHLATAVPHIVLASGTPTPNGVINAWTPGRLVGRENKFWSDNYYSWRQKHFAKVNAFSHRPKPGAETKIRDELAKNALSIRLRDATDIPAELFSVYPFDHGERHNKLIRTFMSERHLEIDRKMFEAGEGDDGGYLTKLHQLTNGFAYFDEENAKTTVISSTARVDALEDIVDNVDGPVLVGIKFLADVAMIKQRFPKAAVLNGSTPAADKSRIVEAWNKDEIPLLLGNPQSMGAGINLQHGSAQTLVWYSAPFSWEQYAQMNARLVRSGQTKVVSIINLRASVGLDRAIAAVLSRKGAGERALMAALDIAKVTRG